jgi:hypothetical protein
MEGMTLVEAWHGRKSGLGHLCTFECIVHVKNTKPHLNKLDDRSTRMTFMGYEPGSKAYWAFDPWTGRVHVNHDIVVDELA